MDNIPPILNADEAMAKCAADWWTRAVTVPRFDALGPTERSKPMEMASLLATMGVKNQPVEIFVAFNEALNTILLEQRPRCLHVDYHPDVNLYEASQRSGLDELRFPWKTVMWLDWELETIRVRHGYGAPVNQIYGEPTDV